MWKVVSKTRMNGKVQKRYDTARTPFQRLIDSGILEESAIAKIEAAKATADPLHLHEHLEKLIQDGPELYSRVDNSAG